MIHTHMRVRISHDLHLTQQFRISIFIEVPSDSITSREISDMPVPPRLPHRVTFFARHTLASGLWLAVFLCCGRIWAQTAISPHGELALACSQCHTPESWRPMRTDAPFDHSQTRFPLAGRHVAVRCVECHHALAFKSAEGRCAACHLDIHRGQFSQSCEGCHTPAGWQSATDWTTRHQQTRFPLTGAHADLECQSCHAAGQYAGLSTECQSCHATAYQATREPDHAAAGFSHTCTQCHERGAQSWSGATFSHPAAFPLTGGHAQRACNACHATGYRNQSPACETCHRADYTAATNPNHTALALAGDCAQCHVRPAAGVRRSLITTSRPLL